MDFEFHYYITGLIANRAGFSEEESKIIAYASQFVDHNTIIYKVKDVFTGELYTNYISQTKNILKPKETRMRVYTAFHFVPGNPMFIGARRKDGEMHWLNTTPDGALAQRMIMEALDLGNLYRIGIASHAYTDTWAHQNFVGLRGNFNGFFGNPIPDIGHSDAFLHPDRVGRKWTDPRLLKSEIDNNERFILAAENLFYQYLRHLGKDTSLWLPVKKEILSIIEQKSQEGRIVKYLEVMPWLSSYNRSYWFDKSIWVDGCWYKKIINSIFPIFKDIYWWRGLKEKTDWFNFQEAVKEHQSYMLPLLDEVFSIMGVNIRQLELEE